MTQEEKAEAYSKAVEKAKQEYSITTSEDRKQWLEELFPELKESNDERIRKEILNYIDKATGCKRWVTWLEKQEDKDSQVKLPTFTFDDILALQCCMETVKKVQEDKDLYEKLNDLHGRVYDAYHLEKQGEQKPVDKVEPKFKVGDWVIDKQGIVYQVANVVENVTNHTYGYDIVGGGYFNDNVEGVRLWNIYDAKEGDVLVDSLGNVCIYQEPSTKLMYHSHGYGNHKFFIPMGGSHEIVGSYPASKEQRDQLEKAMSDAGYVFDFEKKELKEIENEEYDGEDYGIDGLWHAKNILEKTLGKVDGYQSDDGILEHKCAISAVDKLYKHSIAWSEEDKHWMQKAIDFMNHPDLIKATPTLAKDTINWLKSLKGRYVWKPSDEQMKVCKEVYADLLSAKGFDVGTINSELNRLEEKLK